MPTALPPFSISSWLTRHWDQLVWTNYKFRFPLRPLPAVRIRQFRESDLEACSEIYRLNEPGRFPEGYLGHFREYMTSGKALFLVVEDSSGVLGFGGGTHYLPLQSKAAGLSFGMVHPEAQGRGIGTALLLARIAVLPEPNKIYVLSLSPVVKSQSFFRKFGFGYIFSFRETDTGNQFDTFAILIRRRDWHRCRAILAQSAVRLEATEPVPNVPLSESEARTELL